MSMAWIAVGTAAVGALSTASAANARNKAISSAATSNAVATQAMLGQQYDVTVNQGFEKIQQSQLKTGMALTDLLYQGLEAGGKVATKTTEQNLYGASAQRSQQMVKMREALAADTIVQSGEATLVDLQNELRNAKYAYESGNTQSSINFTNAMSQQQSSTEIFANSLSAGISSGSTVYGMRK